jgi:hypothetical protein
MEVIPPPTAARVALDGQDVESAGNVAEDDRAVDPNGTSFPCQGAQSYAYQGTRHLAFCAQQTAELRRIRNQ